MPPITETIVIGAGWAGLACAYELVKAGHTVTILEAAPQVGGRARTVLFQNYVLDNGQHIAIGAYTYLRTLLHELKLAEQDYFKILPFELFTLGETLQSFKLGAGFIPWNLISGLLFKSHVSWSLKGQILYLLFKIKQHKFKLEHDISILEFLKNYHQSDKVIQQFWQPLALAVMSTPINTASAQVFLNVLKATFIANSNASNLYLPSVDLSNTLPIHLATYLERHGAKIFYKQNIQQLEFTADTCTAISNSSQQWQAENVVLAMPPWQAKNLMRNHAALQTSYTILNNFSFEPITTLYFIFAKPIQLPYPMLGFLNATTQWIFDRAFIAQPHILSVVITGNNALQFASQDALKNQVLEEITAYFPHLASPIACKIICEKRAAFSCNVATQKLRPQPATAIKNLWLTGDYLQTGLPATLEGALLSGKKTAEAILDISPRSNQNC